MATGQTGFLVPGAVAAALLFAGCVSVKAPFSPPGGLFTSVKAPLQVEFPEGGVACAAASGSASSLYFHDPLITGASFAWDDCSMQAAAREGRLASVSYADYECCQVLGIFGKTTVTAYGPRAR